MKATNLLQGLEFHVNNPNSQPLYVDANGRVLRFTLRPGQSIVEHTAPSSPFYVVVIQGQGVFAGGDRVEQRISPNTLLVFEPGEAHSIRALDEDLVFVGFLHGVPGTRLDHVGGTMGRE